MEKIRGRVVSVHVGNHEHLAKEAQPGIEFALDGIVGDRHRGYTRECWAGGDKQAEGTVRRNERPWSATSVQELADASASMDLREALTAAETGVNLCLDGIDQLSRLPKGSVLKFPSGAELIVEEYNPPCGYAGAALAESHVTQSGAKLENTAFSKAAKLSRGLVGTVEVPGTVSAGDEVEVTVYSHPQWLQRSV